MIPFSSLTSNQRGQPLETSRRESYRRLGYYVLPKRITDSGPDIIAIKRNRCIVEEDQNHAEHCYSNEHRMQSYEHNFGAYPGFRHVNVSSFDKFDESQATRLETINVHRVKLNRQIKEVTEAEIMEQVRITKQIEQSLFPLEGVYNKTPDTPEITLFSVSLDSIPSFITHFDSLAILGRLKTFRLTKILRTLCITPNFSNLLAKVASVFMVFNNMPEWSNVK